MDQEKLIRMIINAFVPLIIVFIIVMFLYAVGKEVTFEAPKEEAPFAEGIGDQEPTIDLSSPHMGLGGIEAWVGGVVLEAYDLNRENYAAQVEKVKEYFSEGGHAEYASHLESAKVQLVLDKKDMQTNAIVDGVPNLLNESELAGRYRWLYEVPITIGYVPRATKKYNPNEDHIHKKVNLVIQIGRIGTFKEPDKLQIESWSIEPRRD